MPVTPSLPPSEAPGPQPAVPDRARLTAWLRLASTPGLGTTGLQALLDRFGSPAAIFAAPPDALAAHVRRNLADALAAPPDAPLAALIERTLEWAAQPGHHVLTLDDSRYPQRLLDGGAPPVLYALGRIDLLQAPQVAIVGSRKASPQGALHARQFAAELSAAGLTITSGLAYGIDAAAHEGALCGAGSTVAVIGTGIDRVYPPAHHGLTQRIAESGVVVSEFPLGTPPVASNFPRRNRLIAGLARGVLVVEAAARSGSLITARLAAEQGRDVYAIPGSIQSDLARGCHQLIRAGAALVESAADVLAELGWTDIPAAPAAPAAPATDPDPLLDLLGGETLRFDELALRASLPADVLTTRLLLLELTGQVARLPGDRFQRLG